MCCEAGVWAEAVVVVVVTVAAADVMTAEIWRINILVFAYEWVSDYHFFTRYSLIPLLFLRR